MSLGKWTRITCHVSVPSETWNVFAALHKEHKGDDLISITDGNGEDERLASVEQFDGIVEPDENGLSHVRLEVSHCDDPDRLREVEYCGLVAWLHEISMLVRIDLGEPHWKFI